MLIMTANNNESALDIYALGWATGDSAIISRVLDTSYTLSGFPNMESVDRETFGTFWQQFRKDIEKGGGPSVDSSQFMTFRNIIRQKVNLFF